MSKKHLPLVATLVVLIGLIIAASLMYDRFFRLPVLLNLFWDNAFLGIVAIGMTFVILSGGIDLSVGAVLAWTTIFIAVMVQDHGWHPSAAMAAALGLGTVFGSGMGWLIQRFKLPPFLVTLGGMFFARGMAFAISQESIGIRHPFHETLVNAGLALGPGAQLRAGTVIFFLLFAAAFFVAHYTRFGRTVYAIGGNEQSATLMGLPVAPVKVAVYGLNGFCAALAGIVATLYLGSGNPAMGFGLELDAIAAVVIGGTLLSGGVGYVAGTLAGVLILGTIQTALIFDGRLNSWWLRIAVGALLLVFILLQKALTRRSGLAR